MNRIFGSGLRNSALAKCAFVLSALLAFAVIARADEPYARSKDYDLQNVKTHLWFDVEQKKVRGEVTESISMLRDGLENIKFDSVDLTIHNVTVDGKDAKFSTTDKDLIVSLARPSKHSDHHEVFIRYEGQPNKGLYFVLPDKNYPNRPKEVWTQGESEDTRYYIPIYDYPNDRTTSEMLLTVPAAWLTVSNGKLMSTKDERDGMKTWDWKQSEPLSTYLISAVAGEFTEKNDTWRGMPLRFVVPRGDESKIDPTFVNTKQMLDTFSDHLNVGYPWAQYAQTSVNDFVEGGMENTSATTLTTRGLVDPRLAGETPSGADSLDSHEMAHQWFGDLVTCKDWGNLWLNEGFATYFEHFWTQQKYGEDAAAYEFWRDQTQWFRNPRLFASPIVTHDFSDSLDYSGNIYNKGGWVLKMLRTKLGDQNFFQGLHVYLETHRGQNVVTADLQKSIEQATATNVDQFFHQWLYRAGAPNYNVSYAYDDATHQIRLTVKQTQKVEGMVGLFDMPVDVEIATSADRKTYPIELSKAAETFTLASDGAPLMVVFDKGDKVLKTLDFKRDAAALIYQLKNGETVPDRAEAAATLVTPGIRDNPAVIPALGESALHDPFWGVRSESLRTLGRIGGADAEKQVLSAVNDEKPWVREVAVQQLGMFKDDVSLGPRLTDIAASDKAFSVRAAALRSLGEIKASNAFAVLTAAVKSDSPEDTLREAGLRGVGDLGDDRAVALLLEWSALGKPLDSRRAAISAVAGLDKKNKEITQALLSYLKEPYFDIKFAALFSLGRRGDPEAIAPLEDLLKSGDLPLGTISFVKAQIASLKAQASGQPPTGERGARGAAASNGPDSTAQVSANAAGAQDLTLEELKKLQQQMAEISARLAKIESQLSTPK
jgi:aminopeptidase N